MLAALAAAACLHQPRLRTKLLRHHGMSHMTRMFSCEWHVAAFTITQSHQRVCLVVNATARPSLQSSNLQCSLLDVGMLPLHSHFPYQSAREGLYARNLAKFCRRYFKTRTIRRLDGRGFQ